MATIKDLLLKKLQEKEIQKQVAFPQPVQIQYQNQPSVQDVQEIAIPSFPPLPSIPNFSKSPSLQAIRHRKPRQKKQFNTPKPQLLTDLTKDEEQSVFKVTQVDTFKSGENSVRSNIPYQIPQNNAPAQKIITPHQELMREFDKRLQQMQLAKNGNMIKTKLRQHKLTDEEEIIHAATGGFISVDPKAMDRFDFSCQNRKELVYRVKEIASEFGFQLWLKVQSNQMLNRNVQFKFVCCTRGVRGIFKDPKKNEVNDENDWMMRFNCRFYLQYKLNTESMHFTLTDYDDVHNHPFGTSGITRMRLNFRNAFA